MNDSQNSIMRDLHEQELEQQMHAIRVNLEMMGYALVVMDDLAIGAKLAHTVGFAELNRPELYFSGIPGIPVEDWAHYCAYIAAALYSADEWTIGQVQAMKVSHGENEAAPVLEVVTGEFEPDEEYIPLFYRLYPIDAQGVMETALPYLRASYDSREHIKMCQVQFADMDGNFQGDNGFDEAYRQSIYESLADDTLDEMFEGNLDGTASVPESNLLSDEVLDSLV